MHNAVAASARSLLTGTKTRVVSSLIILFALLNGCASSNVSRDAASNVDMGVENADKLGRNFSNGDFVESYQNSSQASKGALLGGATGVLAGLATTSVGIVPGALVGAVLGSSYGSYIDSESSIADQLTNRGATVVELGDQVMVVLPSARIFSGMSAKIKPQGYSTLNLLTIYINSYTKTLVKISAYTDDIGEQNVNLALSKQQAHSVERYLIANNVNARVLYSEGFGASNLVMKNTRDWGKSDNYRLEITFEKLEG